MNVHKNRLDVLTGGREWSKLIVRRSCQQSLRHSHALCPPPLVALPRYLGGRIRAQPNAVNLVGVEGVKLEPKAEGWSKWLKAGHATALPVAW